MVRKDDYSLFYIRRVHRDIVAFFPVDYNSPAPAYIYSYSIQHGESRMTLERESDDAHSNNT
jgi:hypothetical protein